MWHNTIYDIQNKYSNIDELTKTNNQINEYLKKYLPYQTPNEINSEEISDIIYRSEKTALTLRSAVEIKQKNDEEGDINLEINELKNMPIKINFKENILRIYTPFTFKRMYKNSNLRENYMFMNYIKASIVEWQKENKFDLFQAIKPPFDLYFIRRNLEWNPRKICDHDNLENGRIANEIFNALGYSDQAKNVDLHCAFRTVENEDECGMLFVIKHQDIDRISEIM